MADRYFIGGSGAKDWNDSDNWSASSGGAGGSSVPTSADNVYFDANSLSDSCVLTLDAEASCFDLDMTGLSESLKIVSAVYSMNIHGSMTLNSNFESAFTGTAYLYFKATTSETITSDSAVQNWNRLYFDGDGGEWTNQDDWDIKCEINHANGTWNTNNNDISLLGKYITVSGTKALTLGSSIFLLNNNWEDNVPIGFTLNENMSTIKFITTGSTVVTFKGNGRTFYNVEFINGKPDISGNNTFNNLTITGYGGETGISSTITFRANQTINGILTIVGANSNSYRCLIQADSPNKQFTITSAINNIINCDFFNIKGAGDADWDFSDEEIGDCGYNSNIIFRQGENRYWHEGSGNFHDANWYSETNGGGITKTIPLPQDTAIFDENSFSGAATINIVNLRIGNLDMSAVNKEVTITIANYARSFFGNMLFNSNIIWSQNGNWTHYAYCIHGNIIKTGSWVNNLNLQVFWNTLCFGDNANINGSYGLVITNTANAYVTGIDFNNFDVKLSTNIFDCYNTYLRNGTITCIGSITGHTWRMLYGIIYPENSTIIIDSTIADYVTFSRPGAPAWNYHNVYFKNGKNNKIIVRGDSNINDIKIEKGLTVNFTAGTTQTLKSLTAIGTADELITISSITEAQHTLTLGDEDRTDVSFCDISYSNVDANKFYATNCIDSGNNTNWIFVKVDKIVSKWYSNANKIAGVPRNKIEKIMEVR